MSITPTMGLQDGELIETTTTPLSACSPLRLRKSACLIAPTGTAQAELTVCTVGATHFVRYRRNLGAGWEPAERLEWPTEQAAIQWSEYLWRVLIAWLREVEPVAAVTSARREISCRAA